MVAAAIARYPREVQRALAPTGRLVSSGLLTVESRRVDVSNRFELMTGLVDVLCQEGLREEALLTRFLPQAKPTELGWDDFAHMGAEAHLAGDLLRGAVRQRRPGVSILLYGASGKAAPNRPALEAVLAPIERLVEGHTARSKSTFNAKRWSPGGLNCSVDPVALADQLTPTLAARAASRDLPEGSGLSVCLYGRPRRT